MDSKFSWTISPDEKWILNFVYGGASGRLDVKHVMPIRVVHEEYQTAEMQIFDMNTAPWCRTRLRHLVTSECTAGNALIPGSLSIEDENGFVFVRDTDYYVDEEYGTIMRKTDGRMSQDGKVLVSYSYCPSRLDSIVMTKSGTIEQRIGIADLAVPKQPELSAGEKRIANIYFSGNCICLCDDMIFPIENNALPKSPSAVNQLPQTCRKLKSGELLKILVWGDSVTEAAYLPESEHYQSIFLKRLQNLYPDCRIELRSLGWGGRRTIDFINEPPGSKYNYEEQVLDWKPDLIISEFVNDCGMNIELVQKVYSRLLSDFRSIHAEWMILTPHYIKLSWMGLSSQKNCDEDPRPYVKYIRRFAENQGVAIADAAMKYGQLWRTGIPFMTYMVNTINHPDLRGMKLFADTLIEAING